MNNMEYDLFEIVNLIIGHIDICKETNYDDKSLKNLNKCDYVISNYLEELINNIRYYHNDNSYSAQKILQYEEKMLKKYLEDIEIGLEILKGDSDGLIK